MARTRTLWLVSVLVAALGCSDSSSNAVTCVPSCRADFVCVNGACVQACNPPCGNGERCVTSGAAPMCVRDNTPTDAGVAPADTFTPSDAGAPVDAPIPEIDGPATTGDVPGIRPDTPLTPPHLHFPSTALPPPSLTLVPSHHPALPCWRPAIPRPAGGRPCAIPLFPAFCQSGASHVEQRFPCPFPASC